MIYLVQAYWSITGNHGNGKNYTVKGSDLIICSDNFYNEAEDYIDTSGQGKITNVICKKTGDILPSSFEGRYWAFDNVKDFKLLNAVERKFFGTIEEATRDIKYGTSIKKLFDKKEFHGSWSG